MKNSILIIMFVLLVVAISGSVAAQSSQRSQDIYKESRNIYKERYPDRLCPPEYRESREQMERFMAGRRQEKMREHFGDSAPTSMSELQLLNDQEDAAACEYLSLMYDGLINKQVRLFEGGDALYWFDFSFYKGGDFYFVAIGGGFFIEENPETGVERIATNSAAGSGMAVYRKKSFEKIDLAFEESPNQ